VEDLEAQLADMYSDPTAMQAAPPAQKKKSMMGKN